jgi:hypothetical protein
MNVVWCARIGIPARGWPRSGIRSRPPRSGRGSVARLEALPDLSSQGEFTRGPAWSRSRSVRPPLTETTGHPTQVIGSVRDCGCIDTIIVRLNQAFLHVAMIGAIPARARGSRSPPMNAIVHAAIAAIGEDAWSPIRYPRRSATTT